MFFSPIPAACAPPHQLSGQQVCLPPVSSIPIPCPTTRPYCRSGRAPSSSQQCCIMQQRLLHRCTCAVPSGCAQCGGQ
ncbi:hypothetical protein MRB53_034557 [Persea americana]|uniref:Uncharacterized protein n=1 Tax=Persea americana TaxID=3435 RepID=A0ACC2K272_PERAE|nr:hypothetical protein MRB53_034557 [Persea americana]